MASTKSQKRTCIERKYSILSRNSVQLYGESKGFENITDEVLDVLCEDVNYHIRNIIQNGYEMMRLSKRRKLTTDDFNSALSNLNVQPIFGHNNGTSLGPNIRCCQVNEDDILVKSFNREGLLYYYQDDTIDLVEESLNPWPSIDKLINSDQQEILKNKWISIEGTKIIENQLSQNKNETAPITKYLSDDYLQYFSIFTKAILGSDFKCMKLALKNLQTNVNISPVLSYFVNFVHNGVRTVNHDVSQLNRLLYTVKALITNPYLNLHVKPYLSLLMQTIEYCQVEALSASINSLTEHWVLRESAARLASRIIDLWSNQINKLRVEYENSMISILQDQTRPSYSHYGAIMGLYYLGIESIERHLIPIFPDFCSRLLELMCHATPSTNYNVRCDASRVYGTLIIVAEYCILNQSAKLLSNENLTETNSVSFQKSENHLQLIDHNICNFTNNNINVFNNNSYNVNNSSTKSNLFNLELANKLQNPLIKIQSQSNENISTHKDKLTAIVSNKQTDPTCSNPNFKSFLDIYLELNDLFGDSLSSRLPLLKQKPEFTNSNTKVSKINYPSVNLIESSENSSKTGEEMLKEFLYPILTSNGTSPYDLDKCALSSSLLPYDNNISVKSTLSDLSQGIKLTILKISKSNKESLNSAILQSTTEKSSAGLQGSSDVKSSSSNSILNDTKTFNLTSNNSSILTHTSQTTQSHQHILGKPQTSQKTISIGSVSGTVSSKLPGSCTTSNPLKANIKEFFKISTLKNRSDAIITFKFRNRNVLSTFTEKKKAKILARNMAMQHALVSRYRNMCKSLKPIGKKRQWSGDMKIFFNRKCLSNSMILDMLFPF